LTVPAVCLSGIKDVKKCHFVYTIFITASDAVEGKRAKAFRHKIISVGLQQMQQAPK